MSPPASPTPSFSSGLTRREQPGGYRYPHLLPHLPVLSRGRHELQVGFDQEPSLVLAGVHPALREVLTLLDGCHSYADIAVEAARLGVEDSELDWCVRILVQANMVRNGPAAVASEAGQRFRVRLVGAGRLGGAVAAMLVHEVAALHVIDPEPLDPQLYPTGLGTQAEALIATLDAAHPRDSTTSRVRLTTANHWSKPEERVPDLTIMATDRLECDRLVASGLLRLDQPHLVVRPTSQGVMVGPLVVPGQTACLGCIDLARRDHDPAWPQLLSQLARTRVPIRPPMVQWAGAVAAPQALAFLRGGAPETCGATLDLSAPDYLTRWRSWPMHPECGCGWGPLAEWAP